MKKMPMKKMPETLLLTWDKPEKTKTKEEWEAISADNAPHGVYTPNMSQEDSYKWRAKLISGDDLRIEIRKTASGKDAKGRDLYAQIVLILRPDGKLTFSANGTALLNIYELEIALAEAEKVLADNKKI